MYKKISKKAFTLIEILVWMSIIWVIVLTSRNIAFKNMSDNQKIEIFNNKIISEIEKVRNDSLIWKSIWASLNIPQAWKIDFSRNSWWRILTSYTMDWSTWIQTNSIPIENLSNINDISCINVDNSLTTNLSTTQTWSIIFEKWKYRLAWDCPNNYTNLWIRVHSKWYYRDFSFDTISWIIKR